MSLTKLNLFFAMMTGGGSVIMDQTYNQYTLPYFLIMCAVWLILVIVVAGSQTTKNKLQISKPLIISNNPNLERALCSSHPTRKVRFIELDLNERPLLPRFPKQSSNKESQSTSSSDSFVSSSTFISSCDSYSYGCDSSSYSSFDSGSCGIDSSCSF